MYVLYIMSLLLQYFTFVENQSAKRSKTPKKDAKQVSFIIVFFQGYQHDDTVCFIVITCSIKENRIAKGKLVVWLAIGEKVFSVELHLFMKGYCWCESGGKIVAIMKTKMQLVLGKKNTLEMNEFTEN